MPTDIYGIKASKSGYPVQTATDRELNFDSRFDTLKIKQQGTGQIVDGSRTITIAHNLGYVPAFTVHIKPVNYSGYFVSPIIVNYPLYSPHFKQNIFAWADVTNLYIKAQDDVGFVYAYANDLASSRYGGSYYRGVAKIGITGDINDQSNGAVRFSVNKTGTVSKADLGMIIDYTSGDVTTPVRTYGIDEDNTGDFGSYVFDRSRTDAYINNSRDGSIHDTWLYSVTDLFNEIISRGGWSSGNNMGFLLFHQSTVINTAFYCNNAYLRWLPTSVIADIKYTIFYNKIV